MPEAESFTFFGTLNYTDGVLDSDTSVLFNGFPFQLEKVDVSGFDYWTTLGGTTKENVESLTDAEKEANKLTAVKNAVLLYWNLYAVNGSIDFPAKTATDKIDATNDLASGADTPIKRIKPTTFSSKDFGFALSESYDSGERNFTANFYDTLPASANIVAMYNGSTDNFSNFVGCGIKSDVDTALASAGSVPGVFYDFFVDNYGVVYICSYGNDPNYSGVERSSLAYTEFADVPVLCATAAGSLDITSTTPTLDPENLKATSYIATATYSIQLDSFEFYTYS